MSKQRSNYMARADVLFAKMIKERDGACMAVGAMGVTCSGYLQCCHIQGRGELVLRLNEANGITMCQAHHVYFTHRPAAWHDFIDDLLPGRWDELRALAREHRGSGLKVDWKAEYESLRGVVGT